MRARVFEAGADAAARAEVARFAGVAALAVIVVAAHGDGAGAGVAVDHHLHDGGGLAELVVGVVLGLREDAGGADDVGVEIRIERRRRAEAVREVRRTSRSRSSPVRAAPHRRPRWRASVLTRSVLTCPRRVIDSSTAIASSEFENSVPSSPVSTRPVTSLARSTLVGRAAGFIIRPAPSSCRRNRSSASRSASAARRPRRRG